MTNLQPGFEQDGYRFVGGDPASPRSWEPMGLRIGTIDSGFRFLGGDPASQANWEKWDEPGDTMRGAKVALGQTGPLLKGTVGAIGAAAEQTFGAGGLATAVRDWGLRGYEEGMQKMQPLQKPNDELTTAWQAAKNGDVGALIDWAQYGVGYALGQIGETAAVGILGGLAGGALAGPAGAAPGAVAGAVSKGAVKSLARELIESRVASEVGRLAATAEGKALAAKVGEQAAQQKLTAVATKSVVRDIGAGASLGAWNIAQETGGIFGEAEAQARQDGRELDGGDIARVWGAGILAGAVEGFTDKMGLNAAAGRLRLPGAGLGMAGRIGAGAGAAAGLEAGTEALQTGIERFGAGKVLTGTEAIHDYINSAGLGAIGGGLVGGFSGALRRDQPAAEPPAPAAPPLQIGNTPDPFIVFKDGTAARLSEVEAYIAGLPEDQRPTARAKLAGLEPQPADPEQQKMLALPAPVVRVDGAGNARMDGVPVPAASTDEPAARAMGRVPVDILQAPDIDAAIAMADSIATGGTDRLEAALQADRARSVQQQMDAMWEQRRSQWAQQRERDFDLALQELRDATVDQAQALTSAQNFDAPAPTAMQVAFEAARARAPAPTAPSTASSEPVEVWTGRRGAGYLTEGDALMALPSRQRKHPDLHWQIERNPGGQFRLAGYAQAPTPLQGDAAAAPQPPLADPSIPDDLPPVSVPAAAAPTVNPFKTFLIRNGIALRLARDFAPGTRERLAMGRTFREGGLELDALAERAAEAGFISDRMDTDALYELVARVAAGERVAPMLGQDGEAEIQAQVERQRALEQEAAEEFGRADHEVQVRVRELIAQVEAAGRDAESILEEVAKLTENAAEQDYYEAAERALYETLDAQSGEAGARDRSEDARGQGDEAGQRAQEPEGLTSPTQAEVLAQQERAENASALDEREQVAREAEHFTLQQQAAPEQRRDTTGDLLGGPTVDDVRAARAPGRVQEDGGTTPMFSREEQRPAPAGQASLFRRGSSLAAKGISAATLESARGELRAGLGMELQVADTEGELPASAQRRMQSEGIEGVRGVFDPDTGKLWVVRENIADKEELFFVAMHEAFHRGLLRTFGTDVAPILDYIELNNKTVREKAREYRAAHPGMSRRESVEEVLADLAGARRAADLKGWDRLVEFLKNAIAKVALGLGVNVPVTDEMVMQFVAGIRRAGAAEPNGDLMRQSAPTFSKRREPAIRLDARVLSGPIGQKVIQARELAMRMFGNTTVRNISDNADIMIPRSGIKHALSGRVSELAALASTKLDEIVRTARFERAEADSEGRNTIREIRHYTADVEIDGETRQVGVVVRVAADDGRRYYDHFEVKKQTPASMSGEQVEPDSLRPIAGAAPSEDGNDIVPPSGDSGGQRFSRATIAGATNRQYSAAQKRAMRNVGFEVDEPTMKERAAALWQDAGKKMAQGIVDQFAPVKDLDREAYGLMRLAKGASGAFEVFLRGGKLKLTDGVYDFDDSDPGGVVDRLLIPLHGEHHDFFRWVAASRAERLMREGKEHLFTAQDIADLKTLESGTTDFDYTIQHGARAGQVTRDRTLIYRDSLVTFNEFNKNVLDLAEQSGLIDGASRHLWEHEFYVPFYRVSEDFDGGFRGASIKSGVVRQQAFKQLKGGKEKLNADLLDNTLLNWAHLLDAAAKNRAAKATLEAAERMGVAVNAPESTARAMGAATGNRNGIVWFMDQGEKRFFLVDEPYILTAITALEYAGLRSPLMNAMSTFKHMLTVGVTASPFFKVRNLIRDSVQVIGTSSINANPIANVAEGWKLTDPKSAEYFRLLAGGGTIHFGTMLEGSEARRVQALVESGVDDATILNSDKKFKAFYRQFVEPAVTAYNELGNRGEAINRAALYEQLRAQGMSHAEASLQARDLMDFSMQGSWSSIRFLTQVVPFLNARLQGLYKLGRGAKEDPARFAAVLGAVTLTSLSLLWAYGDDDDWKKREEWDRDNFWWFKIGGTAFRVPKPFEIGAIATLAERGWELAFDKEMTGKRFGERLLHLLGDNLSMNPIPQLVKPMLDVYANKDSFSGRPIESMGMERLKAGYRFNERTSMAARGVSTVLNSAAGLVGGESLSPVQVDHMLRGYFGWLGAFVVGSADMLARPATDQPVRAAPDYWKTATGGMVSQLDGAPSRYVSQMYEQADAIAKAYGTWRQLAKEGKTIEAGEFFKEHAGEIGRHRSVERVKRAESQLNERVRIIERSNLSADAKRDMIQLLRTQKDRIARQIAPA